MRIAQICNVGEICGGTGACAWSMTHAFPDIDHTVIFLSRPTSETTQAFQHCRTLTMGRVTDAVVRDLDVDLVLMHNSHPSRVEQIRSVPSIQYHHSVGERTTATLHVACSEWLSRRDGNAGQPLWQPVPIPPCPTTINTRNSSGRLIIGRICTPTLRKWPRMLLPFYQRLARSFDQVDWEFVGAPDALKSELREACCGRATFVSAGVTARSHLWNWHAMLYHHPGLTESFGRTVAEAMRCGTVPIVDQRGGFCEQITSKQNGYLCRNEEDYSFAIQQLGDVIIRKRLSEAAQQVSQHRNSLANFRKRFLELLQQL